MSENRDKLKINVSFPRYDKYIYDYIKSQPNPSAFIRTLVEAYMRGNFDNHMNLNYENKNIESNNKDALKNSNDLISSKDIDREFLSWKYEIKFIKVE